MRYKLALLLTLLLVFTAPIDANASALKADQPVVHAVVFWTSGCSFCTETLTTILPVIQDKYQSKLSLLMIELASSREVDQLYALGASLGLAKEQVALPFLVIDHTVLVGVDDIHDQLPGLVDSYLASGGVEVPNMPQLNEMLPRGIDFASSEFYLRLVSAPSSQPNSLGFILAWVIMALMWAALILSVVMILRGFRGKTLGELRSWMDVFIPLLAIVGLGASIYLTYVEMTHTRALCGPVGDCNAVQSSPYAKLFGFLPIGLVGAIGYIAILASWFWRRFRKDAFSNVAGPSMYAMALFGTLFSIYLTYLELFVIHAVCIWCLASAIIITALMLLNLPPITQWLAISDEEE